MWGTIITDAYMADERQQIADALDEICSPRDEYAFASGGIYCFWNLKTRQPLYIGRAVDLPDRFRAHNGIKSRGAKGNKQNEIEAFFEEEQLLGYTILVRSTLSQTFTARRRRHFGPLPAELDGWVEEPDAIGTEAEYEIAGSEGTAIRSFWLEHGALPPWNKIQGERTAWNQSMRRHDDSGSLFCASIDSLLQARKTLRELGKDPLSVEFELELHGARIWAVRNTLLGNVQLCDRDILEMLDRLPERGGGLHLEAMRESGYLLGGPWVSSALAGPVAQIWREEWSKGRPLSPSMTPPVVREADEMPGR